MGADPSAGNGAFRRRVPVRPNPVQQVACRMGVVCSAQGMLGVQMSLFEYTGDTLMQFEHFVKK